MATVAFPTRDDFAALLNDTLGGESTGFEGRVVKGTVTAIENDVAVIDVGLKSEGRVPLREFAPAPGVKAELKVGDEVEVYVDRVENSHGEAMLSRDRARREAAWDKLEGEFAAGNRVDGVIFGRVKGGFTVDLNGAVAFLPGSQVDIRPVRDVTPLMDIPQPFQVLKMDRRRGNIVVSRRAVLEETRAEQRTGLIQSLAEGQVVDGVVKNITDYGAFVDLGGIDGLLHVTDISYKRVNHPSEVINIGDTVRVQIVRINRDTQRISLGMKQLESDPWEGAGAKYPVGAKFSGRVSSTSPR
jgi:small subunit ribosomal protein S1